MLSVLMPAYNEAATIKLVIERIRATGIVDEIVIVDDGSSDGTRDILAGYVDDADVNVIFHAQNAGKGAALRTAMQAARGDIMIVQDADLEYDPADYPRVLGPIEHGDAQVVYGSRFLNGIPKGILPQSAFANRLLTIMTNVLFGCRLADMETCYKAFRREVIADMSLRANRFDFEPEFTAKILKRGIKIIEVPISFDPRSYGEGKKIGVMDGVAAVFALAKYRVRD